VAVKLAARSPPAPQQSKAESRKQKAEMRAPRISAFCLLLSTFTMNAFVQFCPAAMDDASST
jgi:hypothetical protein